MFNVKYCEVNGEVVTTGVLYVLQVPVVVVEAVVDPLLGVTVDDVLDNVVVGVVVTYGVLLIVVGSTVVTVEVWADGDVVDTVTVGVGVVVVPICILHNAIIVLCRKEYSMDLSDSQ